MNIERKRVTSNFSTAALKECKIRGHEGCVIVSKNKQEPIRVDKEQVRSVESCEKVLDQSDESVIIVLIIDVVVLSVVEDGMQEETLCGSGTGFSSSS